jgi:hypothetical protein
LVVGSIGEPARIQSLTVARQATMVAFCGVWLAVVTQPSVEVLRGVMVVW